MNPFERFDAILNKRKPDKIPFYYPTVACTVASELLGREVNSGGDSLHFKEELSRLSGETAHNEFVHKYHEDAIELNKLLKADIVRETWRMRGKPTKKLDDYTLLFGEMDGPHIIKRFFPENQCYGVVEDTTGLTCVEELVDKLKAAMKRDTGISEDILESDYADQLAFKKLADPYFPSIAGGPSVGLPMHSVVWLEATALEPELLAEYFLYSVEKDLPHIKFLASKGYKFINGGMDMASNAGPVYSPAFFKKAIAPAVKLLADECSKYGVNYCFRTDGNIWSVADSLFNEAGCQAYGEVDREAGMEVGKLRSNYPDVLLLGNISSSTLHTGTEEAVRNETRATLEESEGYSYIVGPSNAIMHGTPVRNIYAMLEEIENYKP